MRERRQPGPGFSGTVVHGGGARISRQALAQAAVEARIANPGCRFEIAAIAAL